MNPPTGKKAAGHACRTSPTCRCSVAGLEPAEDCPIHGWPDHPPRCDQCGRFYRRMRQAVDIATPEPSPART